ncbi:MAG: hypothetical protein ACHREM_25160 [Polyangiales bacterium]
MKSLLAGLAIVTCAVAVLSVGGAAGCASGSVAAECRTGADCASGACGTDGKCTDAPAPTDSGTTSESSSTTDALTGCTGNGDGTITASELPLAAGLHATFRVAASVTVDTTGQTDSTGHRTWDLSAPLNGDKDVGVVTFPVAPQWFGSSFSGASYASALSPATTNLLGVFDVGAASVTLRGVASPTSGSTQTLLTYTTPPRVLILPLSATSTWTDTSALSGTTSGIASYVTDAYTSSVDAHGTLKTPYGAFEVLRVSTVLTRTTGVVPTITRTFAFVAECFGTVATITSNADETATEFTSAASVERIAP